MRLALYQPDIPQNTGALLRLGACLEVPVDIIEPCGFIIDDKRLRRVAMDYAATCDISRHSSWEVFLSNHRSRGQGRMVLLTTAATASFTDQQFKAGDTLLLGRESAGVPAEVHETADARVCIPMATRARSLNVVTAAAMVLGEALRQQGVFSRR
ncbi:MAG TPA: tRNA methyltransferase [Rhodospirillaceae bacterium]|nr:tRNA methyltransferase [Rhodospirillaceae bacterium]|tara:strand:+ start:316 stop:780 length:465 start_codon:yes stop_codon:yes gene_type:complete